MSRIVVIALFVLSVAALSGFFAGNDARHAVQESSMSRCAAFAAADMDCPYSK